MVASEITTIAFNCTFLSYDEVCEIASRALAIGGSDTVHIKLDYVAETTTAALARLVALRRDLRRSGRDLQITGLCGEAESLYGRP